jgi:CTP:molybdopterin cytidylyltransferase MocA
LELAVADDERVVLGEPVGREGVAGLVRAHDVVVVPSLWECWPYVALEAMWLNRPVLATPVGGLVELVEPGVSGWLAEGTGWRSVAGAVEGLLDRGGEVEGLVRSGSPAARARALCDEAEIVDGYRALAELKPRRRVARGGGGGSRPLVSAVVPYYRASRYVAETVESLLAQTYRPLEVVVVNDGSFEEDDWALAELAARLPVVVVSQMNQGLGAARNFGIAQSRGRYVFPLDADNVAEPEFVARCVEVLEARPEVAYVTSWSRFVEADGTPRAGPVVGYQPLGNQAALLGEENVGGDAAAVIRRRIFDLGFAYSEELTSYEDWHFYRELRHAGHFGTVIPERLLRYRVREDSMLAQVGLDRRARLQGEIEAHLRENQTQWTSSNA